MTKIVLKTSFILGILSIYIWLAYRFLLTIPAPWPDEAIYADIARNIAFYGNHGTKLWEGSIPFVENQALWYPPIFINITVFAFKILGVSISSQRLPSVVAGLLILVLFLTIFRKNKWWWFAGLILASDIIFLRGSRLSRPEIFVTLFVFLSAFFAMKSIKFNSGYRTRVYAALSGLFAAMGAFTHYLAAVYAVVVGGYLLVAKWRNRRLIDFFHFVGFLVITSLIWVIELLPNWDILVIQSWIIGVGRKYSTSWIQNILNYEDASMKFLVFGQIILFLSVCWDYIKRRTSTPLLFFLLLISSWLVNIFGKIEWYFVYPVAFVYMSIFSQKNLSRVTLVALALIFGLNAFVNLSNYLTFRPGYYSFEHLTRQVLGLVPDGKSVYLSSIPDMYYAFLGRNNVLYDFPVVPLSVKSYTDILDKADYIVVNRVFAYFPATDIFDKYVKRNGVKVVGVRGDENQDSIAVIELKPRDQRVRVGLE